MDAGWFTAIGAVAGAFGTGAKDLLLGRQKRKADKDEREAKAIELANQRQHEKDERAAQDKRDLKAAVRAERAAKIAEWRAGLSESHKEHTAWQVRMRTDMLKQAMDPGGGEPRPNALTAVWLQSLWPYLDEDSNGVRNIKGWTAVYVDGNVAATLTDEIARIEMKWQSEDDG